MIDNQEIEASKAEKCNYEF